MIKKIIDNAVQIECLEQDYHKNYKTSLLKETQKELEEYKQKVLNSYFIDELRY